MIKIQDIMRAGHIKRWNTINTTRQQTLAEHMYNVTMIAKQLCRELGLTYPDVIISEVINLALMHDVPEVILGDTPTPTKKRLEKAGVDMEDIYDEICPAYKDVKGEACQLSHWIVKMADLIEAYWFIRENGVGDHAKMVADKICVKLKAHAKKDKGHEQFALSVFNRVVGGKTYE